MEQLDQTLRQATAGVAAEYFLLSLDGGDPVYRERVYCYELYHQMRQRWPAATPYRLNGEVDKEGHPYFLDRPGGKPKPDLLVHQPGARNRNHAVIEVKSVVGQYDLEKDLLTLSKFTNDLGYVRAISLIYGAATVDRLTRRLTTIAIGIPHVAPIEIRHHEAPGTEARLAHTLPACPALWR